MVTRSRRFRVAVPGGKDRARNGSPRNAAERIRAAGVGIGGFFTPTSVGTPLAAGKEEREIDGRAMVLEQPLPADYALIKAWKADRWGNLVYRRAGAGGELHAV